ncbi:GvpT/GvpP family gas vesicle accessory protein [Pseudalkalibacillus sp. Hm43]|uniref:GvpT/GvpP family gas vesicle accessory protein n=1 Tax=Pseudalkalibacillus sp. Hm43 TaxID=3450742 RepID=UPI003F41B7A0
MANQSKKDDSNQTLSMNFAVLGGIIGAGIGLLTTPGTGKKVIQNINQSETMRAAGNELRRTAQQIITDQLVMTFRETAAGYRLKRDASQGNQQENDDSDRYQELKEENKQLNEHLQRIEEKLDALMESKK